MLGSAGDDRRRPLFVSPQVGCEQMLRERVKSRSIRAVGYDERQEWLWIEFRSRPGGYIYFDVPHDVFDELMQDASLGGYVNEVIKPNYRCEYRAQPPL